jgi:hypothetical protein
MKSPWDGLSPAPVSSAERPEKGMSLTNPQNRRTQISGKASQCGSISSKATVRRLDTSATFHLRQEPGREWGGGGVGLPTPGAQWTATSTASAAAWSTLCAVRGQWHTGQWHTQNKHSMDNFRALKTKQNSAKSSTAHFSLQLFPSLLRKAVPQLVHSSWCQRPLCPSLR